MGQDYPLIMREDDTSITVATLTGELTVSFEGRYSNDNRECWDIAFKADDVVTSCSDVRTSCGGTGTPRSMLETCLSCLGAAVEARQYRERRGETTIDEDSNESLFPASVVDWAYQYSDYLSILVCELEEGGEG